ncbi:unnamed protein product [Ranitomeya imitator]|uniref:Uncharacterized protein n=1 Tax=Ranitomeya imitator TaxID=111125 RepID=A0ABN9LKV4_9NEOB|nr:unnamed protein product [Ranitomeya imitator]
MTGQSAIIHYTLALLSMR